MVKGSRSNKITVNIDSDSDHPTNPRAASASTGDWEDPATQTWAQGQGLNKRQALEVQQSVDKAREIKGTTYECSSCANLQRYSEILAVTPTWISWEGQFCLLCFDCCQARSGPRGPWKIGDEVTQAAARTLDDAMYDDDWHIMSANPDLNEQSWTVISGPTIRSEICFRCCQDPDSKRTNGSGSRGSQRSRRSPTSEPSRNFAAGRGFSTRPSAKARTLAAVAS